MSNRFFITLLVVLAVVIGAFTFTKQKSNPAKNSNTSVQPTNHIEGSDTGGVVLVEYGDYQCPACGQYYPIVKQVFEKYKGQIIFQFRNFPLVQIHKNAFVGSRAAEAADKQGKYWEMHALLYENQQGWGVASNPIPFFEGYAKQLSLDVTKFQQDMNSQETNDKINADIQEGQKLGASSTPTFVLNGKKLEQNPRSIEEFNKLIDDALASKKAKQ
jgi:protein-disulfide isomerase